MQEPPSHRQLLTSLADSLSRCPPPDAANPLPYTAANPDRRHLLLTLHVLFPGLVLPALDLLDRGLVGRLALAGPADNAVGCETERPLQSSLSSDATSLPKRKTASPPANHTYIVRSLATTIARRGRDSKASSKTYAVHLQAWNCSCTNFALDAFPNLAEAFSSDNLPSPVPEQDQEGWPGLFFGGLSLDGLLSSSESVPCCKHLLACLLAESWGGTLSGYIEEHSTSKEGLAAAVASV